MAPKVTKGTDRPPPNRNACVTTKIHLGTLELLDRICIRLEEQAATGLKIPVRIDLGRVHVLDQAVKRMAKEIGVS